MFVPTVVNDFTHNLLFSNPRLETSMKHVNIPYSLIHQSKQVSLSHSLLLQKRGRTRWVLTIYEVISKTSNWNESQFLQCLHSNHECHGSIFTLFVLFFHLVCSYFYIFTELTNHVRETMAQTFFLLSSVFLSMQATFAVTCHIMIDSLSHDLLHASYL